MSDFYNKTAAALKEIQKSNKNLIGWELIQTESSGYQKLYQGHKEKVLVPHQERKVDEQSYHLTVYTNFSGDGYLGSGSSNILPYFDINKQIDEAIELSKNSRNKTWKLLEKPGEEYPEVLTYDKEIKEFPEKIIPGIEAEAKSAIKNISSIHVNSAETFVNFKKITRETNTGIKTYKEKSDIYFEIAMEKAGTVNDKEVHEKIESVSRKDLKLQKFIEECAIQVESLIDSEEPETSENAVIVVGAESIAAFLSAIISQLSCSREYHKLPYLKENDKVYKGEKNPDSDRLSITLDPFIPEMALSTAYTGEGMIAEKMQVIKDDIVQYRLVNNRYGQYMDLKPNGITGNIVIQPGKTSFNDFKLIEKEYLEIIKFSSLLVDDSKLTWSSEIKLAKLYKNDGSFKIIKGGVVSGKISENLSNFIFSRETEKVNSPGTSYDGPEGYIGPKKMLIRSGVSIVGKQGF